MSFDRLTPGEARAPHEWLAEVRPAERARDDRPFVFLNMVASVDGRATIAGRSRALGSDADTLLLTELRALADAVLIGSGTLRAEGYGKLVGNPERVARRVAAGRAPTPPAVLLSRSLDLPWDAGLFAADGPARAGLHARGRARAAGGRGPARAGPARRPDARRGARRPARARRSARCSARAARRSTARCSAPASSTSCSSRSPRCSRATPRRCGSSRARTSRRPCRCALGWVLHHDGELYLRYRVGHGG